MSQKALRSFGIGVASNELDAEEWAHRAALLKKVFKDVKPLKDAPDDILLPGLGPHPGFPAGDQLRLTIPDDILTAVSEKIIRGCEYKLNSEAYIEKPRQVAIYFVHDKGSEDLTKFLDKLPQTALGPGFEISREENPPSDVEHIVMYRVTIWGTLKIYATVDEQGDPRKAKLSNTDQPSDG